MNFTPPRGCQNPNFCFTQSCPRTPRCRDAIAQEEIPKPTEQPTGRPPSEQFKPECSIEQLLDEADNCSTWGYERVLLHEVIARLRVERVTVRGTRRPLDEFDPK